MGPTPITTRKRSEDSKPQSPRVLEKPIGLCSAVSMQGLSIAPPMLLLARAANDDGAGTRCAPLILSQSQRPRRLRTPAKRFGELQGVPKPLESEECRKATRLLDRGQELSGLKGGSKLDAVLTPSSGALSLLKSDLHTSPAPHSSGEECEWNAR